MTEKYSDVPMTRRASIRWKKPDDSMAIFVATETVSFTDIRGKDRTTGVHLRVDGRSPTKWNVDKKTIGPWEDIAHFVTFKSEKEAKAFAWKWLQAAREQKTLDPDIRAHG